MSDQEFLSYVESHSRTELALFHRDHIVRLLKLADAEKEWRVGAREWISFAHWDAQPLVDKARELMKR